MLSLSVNRPEPIGRAWGGYAKIGGMAPDFRKYLAGLIKDRGSNFKDCSEHIGRSHAYIQQYISKGKPQYLDRGDLESLEEFLGLEAGTLDWGRRGYRPPGNSRQIADKQKNRFSDALTVIPELSIQPEMGDGAIVDIEFQQGIWGFMRDYLSAIVRLSNPANGVIVEVDGDSMEPTLRSGDRVMVDTGNTKLVPGQVYAVRDELTNTVMVKRLARATEGDPNDRRIRVISDNSERATHILPIENIVIIGRVVWMARRL